MAPPVDPASLTVQDRRQLAQELLALTSAMLECARAGDWAVLAGKEERRQEVARELFASPVPAEAAGEVADCIRQLLSIDQELLALVDAGREEAASAMQNVRTAKKATDAYRRFSR